MYGFYFGSLSIASCMHSIVVVSPVGMYAPKQVYWRFPVTSKNDITLAPSIPIDSTVQNRDVQYANLYLMIFI
jgi:hypothetical protein